MVFSSISDTKLHIKLEIDKLKLLKNAKIRDISWAGHFLKLSSSGSYLTHMALWKISKLGREKIHQK